VWRKYPCWSKRYPILAHRKLPFVTLLGGVCGRHRGVCGVDRLGVDDDVCAIDLFSWPIKGWWFIVKVRVSVMIGIVVHIQYGVRSDVCVRSNDNITLRFETLVVFEICVLKAGPGCIRQPLLERRK